MSVLEATRLGVETPRIWTPPLAKLTPKTSAGFECIAFAEDILGMVLRPWQKWLLVHALELLPDKTYRFRTVVLLVARQNGKSTVMQVLSLWRMFVDGAPLVIGTAQNLDVAEEQWQGAVDLAENIPELDAEIAQVCRVNGKKFLRLDSGPRYKVASATRSGGRGLSGDLVLLDELREHQTWMAWSAVTKTTMAREQAQIWTASNAGDGTSVVLDYLREMAHAALGNPDGLDLTPTRPVPDDVEEEDGDSLGIFEWSALPQCDIWDRNGWAQANPSLGYPLGISERAIASAARTDPEPVFRTEVLCQWVDLMSERVIPVEQWVACRDPSHRASGKLAYALDAGEKGEWTSIAASDGTHVEIVANRPGTHWVVAACVEKRATFGEIVIDPATHAGSLIDALRKAGVPVKTVTPREYAQACSQFLDAVKVGTLRHIGQPELETAAAGADRRDAGDGAWAWSRKRSNVDIAPLVAVTLAKWASATAGALTFAY